MLYHIYLITDISRYKSTALKNQKIKQEHEEKMADFYRKHEVRFHLFLYIELNESGFLIEVIIGNSYNLA